MRLTTPVLALLLTFGCAKAPASRSGDLIWFLCEEIPKHGGRISFTGPLPRAQSTWTFTSTKDRLVVDAVGDHMATVDVFLKAGFGSRTVSTNDAQGQSHWIYTSRSTGTVIECVATTNGLRLVCSTPTK